MTKMVGVVMLLLLLLCLLLLLRGMAWMGGDQDCLRPCIGWWR